PDGARVVVVDPERVRTRAHDLVATSEEFLQAGWANAAAGNQVPVDLEEVLGTGAYWSVAETREHALETGRGWWTLTSFGGDVELDDLRDDDGDRAVQLRVTSTVVDSYRSDVARVVADVRGWLDEGHHVVVALEGPGLARRVAEVLSEHDLPHRLDVPLEELAGGVVQVTTGRVGRGFVAPDCHLAVVGETDLTGQAGTGGSTRDMRRMPSRRRNQ